jgi:hypothetical protein
VSEVRPIVVETTPGVGYMVTQSKCSLEILMVAINHPNSRSLLGSILHVPYRKLCKVLEGVDVR